MTPTPRGAWRLATLLGWLAVSSGALAQYRPPPMTESERLTVAGDDAREEAARQLAAGNKGEAESRYRKAIEYYEKSLAMDGNAINAAAGLGAAGAAVGEHKKVVDVLSPIAKAHPDELGVVFQLGVAYYKLKRYDEAVPLLEKVSPAKDATFLLAHYYLALYYLHQQRGAPAITELNRYFQLRPSELASKDAEIWQLQGHAYLSVRQPAYARTAFQRAQQGRPESLSIQMGLEAVLEMEGKLTEAATLLEGLMARNPKAPEPRERMGRVLIASNDLKRAEAVANELVRLQSTGSTYLLLGDVRLAQRQGSAAESALRKALELSPGMLSAQLSLAKALQLQGKNEEAIALLEGAAKAGADTVEVWAVLGSVNRRAGHMQRAIEMHKRVVGLAPQLAFGHVLLGADHYATGQWDQAIDDYEEAVKLDSADANARRWLSLSLAHRARQRADANRLDEAVPDLRRAYDLQRVAPMARLLAQVLLAQRSYKDAKAVLEQGQKLSGTSWQDAMLYGYALLGSGEADQAVATFEQAMKQTKEEEALSDIYTGWALAKVEAGDFDAAVAKLSEPGVSKRALKVAQANMPMALLRRAMSRLAQGDVDGAEKDVEGARKLAGGKDSETANVATFVRALVDAEEGRYADAVAGFRKALGTGVRWAQPNAKALLDAYLQYRQGHFPEARKALAPVQKKLDVRQAEWASELGRAISRREGERAYAQGNMAAAEKALKGAAAGDPSNPYVLHNLACVRYRKGQTAEAVATWLRLEASPVHEAALNLGIDAQEKKKDVKTAVAYYRKYIASGGGSRGAMVRDWKDRLQAIYGVADSGDAGATVETTPP